MTADTDRPINPIHEWKLWGRTFWDTKHKRELRPCATGSWYDFPRPCWLRDVETGEELETTAEQVKAWVDSGEWVDTTAPMEPCLDGPDGCEGAVEYRTLDGVKSWPRCERHFMQRLEQQEHIQELTSPTPASWFDPAQAGERWDDDY